MQQKNTDTKKRGRSLNRPRLTLGGNLFGGSLQIHLDGECLLFTVLDFLFVFIFVAATSTAGAGTCKS